MQSQSYPVRAATSLESGIYKRLMWRLLPFLFLCYMCAYLDRINVSFAKLQMMSDLSMSSAVYGLGAGIFFIGYFLFEVPSNLFLLRVGARFWIARIMVTWGIVAAAMMFVRSPTSFYVLRFLLGAAEAGFIPAILFYLTCWFPAARRGKVTALFLVGIPMSGLIGGPISGWIMEYASGTFGLAGWQWLFLLEGLPTALIGVIAYFYLDDKVEDAKWLTQDEKALIQRSLDEEHLESHALHSIKDGLTNPRALLLSCTYFFFIMGLYGVSFWLPTLIKDSGVSDTLEVGLLSAIPYAAAAIAMVVVSLHSDKTGERRWHLSVPGVVGAVGLCLSVAYAHNVLLAVIALTIATMGVMTTISQFWVIPPAILSGAAAAAGIALVNSIGNLAGVVSPYLVGWLKTTTGTTSWGVLGIALCMVIGSLLVFAFPARMVNSGRHVESEPKFMRPGADGVVPETSEA